MQAGPGFLDQSSRWRKDKYLPEHFTWWVWILVEVVFWEAIASFTRKFNSLPLKIGDPKRKLVFQSSLRGELWNFGGVDAKIYTKVQQL